MQEIVPELKKHKMSLMVIIFIVWSYVANGCYGLEGGIASAGPGLLILLLVVMAFTWGYPLALVAAEFGSAIPLEGGAYKWCHISMGEFWGFQNAWSNMLATLSTSAVFPVLAENYLSQFLTISPIESTAIKVFIVLIFAYINIRGVQEIGLVTTIFSIFILGTFAIVSVIGFMHWHYNPVSPFMPHGQSLISCLAFAIPLCIWEYSSFECMGTMAGEVENVQVIPKAVMLAIPLIILSYLIPTVASLAAVGHWQDWATTGGISYSNVMALGGWAAVGLGVIFLASAMISNCSLYNVFLASGSRSLYAVADDKLAPPFLMKINKRYGTPYVSVIVYSLILLPLLWLPYQVLVTASVVLSSYYYLLIFTGVVKLRIKQPELARPFKIALGVKGLIALLIIPSIVILVPVFINGWDGFLVGLGGVASGVIIFYIFKKLYGGITADKETF